MKSQTRQVEDVMRSAILLLLATVGIHKTAAQELPGLPPITPEELKMADVPSAPGGKAVIFYYNVDTDNNHATETISIRMKVLREEGLKYANIEIPYVEKYSKIEALRARTIGSDGKIEEFAGQPVDKEVIKAKKFRVSEKVIVLSKVQIGTIIEYSYQYHTKGKVPDGFIHPMGYLILDAFTYPAAEWEIQRDIFVQHAHFVLHKPKEAAVRVHTQGNVKREDIQTLPDGSLVLDLKDIPAFEEEEYSMPGWNLKTRADLYYALGFVDVGSYWSAIGTRRGRGMDAYVGDSKAIRQEVARLTTPGETDEALLRKLYARSQEIRNLSHEAGKTEKELKQEKLKDNKNAEDVLKHGYGWGNEPNLLFVALARAAGFQAYPLLLATKNKMRFEEMYPDEEQLTAMVVQVRKDKQFWYLDPASALCPFGLLPWEESHSGGVIANPRQPKTGTTPMASPTDALTEKEGTFRLSEEGKLIGKVKISYHGQEAFYRRRDYLQKDEAARREHLEKDLKDSLYTGAVTKLVLMEGWDKADVPLRAEFDVEISNFASAAGKRLVLPVGVFEANQTTPFSSGRRVHPICFDFPQEVHDRITIELPESLKAEAIPADQVSDQNAVYYKREIKQDGKNLRLNRVFRVNGDCFDTPNYPALRLFYERVLTGDGANLTIVPVVNEASK